MDCELHTALVIGAESGKILLLSYVIADTFIDSEDKKLSNTPGHELPVSLHSGIEAHIRAL